MSVVVEVVILMKLFGEWNRGEGFFSIVIIIKLDNPNTILLNQK